MNPTRIILVTRLDTLCCGVVCVFGMRGPGGGADDSWPLTGQVDSNPLYVNNFQLGVNRPAFAPYFIPDCCSRISGAMKRNLNPPTGNPPPGTFTGPGFRPVLSANDGERAKIPTAQLLIDSIRAGVTRQ